MAESGRIFCYCMAIDAYLLPVQENIQSDSKILAGIAGEPLFTISHCGIVVVYGKADNISLNGKINPANYLHLLESIGKGVSVMPFRIETVVNSLNQLRSYIEKNKALIKNVLILCDGSLEYSIRIYEIEGDKKKIDCIPHNDDEPGGYQYLLNKYSIYRRQREGLAKYDEIIKSISGVLRGNSSWKKQDNIDDSAWPLLFRETYLVHKEKVHKMIAEFNELKENNSSLKLVMTGPWLPFTFVDAMMNTSEKEN